MSDIESLDYDKYKKKKKSAQTDVFLDQVSESREGRKGSSENMKPLSDKVNEIIDGGGGVMTNNPYGLKVLNGTIQEPKESELYGGYYNFITIRFMSKIQKNSGIYEKSLENILGEDTVMLIQKMPKFLNIYVGKKDHQAFEEKNSNGEFYKLYSLGFELSGNHKDQIISIINKQNENN